MRTKLSTSAILIALIGLITGMFAFVAPAATAATGGNPEQPATLVVTASANDDAHGEAHVDSETRAVIDGATQVSWEVPDHHVTVTKKQLKKAPRVRVNATGANSSKVIFKTAKAKLFKKYKKSMSHKRAKKLAVKHSGIVVLKKGSCVRNTGRENALRVGFVWCLAYDAVLVFDKKSGQYRHAYNIRDGQLIKTCLNYIGGNVPMRDKVVQVRYEEDVLIDVVLSATAKATATAKGTLACPAGTLEGYASASGVGTAGPIVIRVKQKLKAQTIADESAKLKLKAELNANIDAEANASAEAYATVKLTCGDTPPPPPVAKPTLVEIDTINDVLVNNSRTITVRGTVAPSHVATLFCTANTGSITAGKEQTVSESNFARQITYTAGDEPGYDQVTCYLTQDDGQSAQISTNQFEIRPAPVDPL